MVEKLKGNAAAIFKNTRYCNKGPGFDKLLCLVDNDRFSVSVIATSCAEDPISSIEQRRGDQRKEVEK